MDEINQMEGEKILVPETLREEKVHIEPIGESITLTAATVENLIKERLVIANWNWYINLFSFVSGQIILV